MAQRFHSPLCHWSAASHLDNMMGINEVLNAKSLTHFKNIIAQFYILSGMMTLVDPEGLERRSNVGRRKRHRGPTGTFTSLVRYFIFQCI